MRKRRAEHFTFKRRGMTLVELLITLIIGGIVMGSVSLLFVAFFRNFNMHDDLAAAQQNAEMGLSLIETYVLQAGMGMPSNSSADFQAAFATVAPVPTPAWNGWSGSIEPYSKDLSSNRYTALNVLAARGTVPAVGSAEEKKIGTSAASLTVKADPSFSGGSSLGGLISQYDWVVFPASRLPFLVTANPATNTLLQLRSVSSDTVQLFDTLHVLENRSFSAGVNSGQHRLFVNGVPTEISIVNMDVEWNPDTRLLQVVLLARGKEELGHQVAQPPGWPGKPLTSEERRFRHVAVGRIWRIRN